VLHENERNSTACVKNKGSIFFTKCYLRIFIENDIARILFSEGSYGAKPWFTRLEHEGKIKNRIKYMSKVYSPDICVEALYKPIHVD
jgi:hypothetical protein